MMEQPELSAPSATSIMSLRVALSDEARASLEAVRVAQDAARQRGRRQTRQARLLFATGAAAAVLLVAGLAPRVARWRNARRSIPIAALPPPRSLPPAPRATTSAPETSVAPAPGAARSLADSADRAPAEPPPDTAGCDVTSVRTAPWRLSPEACARAFEAAPTNAALALAVGQAEHARGHLTEGAQWAKRALALDPKAAEAYVLIARADTEDGRREEASAAYRHYLELAPRGWHHAEARRALRGAHP
jgi:tetratricopeptide (TPR) repeat protein